MTIAANALAEVAISADRAPPAPTKRNVPPKRRIIAKADRMQQPEPR
jgi:hypothetical protein